jgi:hypothetical protein
MTAATPLARYGAMWRGALRKRLRYRRKLHHHSGHDRAPLYANLFEAHPESRLPFTEYDPTVHFDQVKDKWIGLRTPDGR